MGTSNCTAHLRVLTQMACAGAAAQADDRNTDLVVIDDSLLRTAADLYRETCDRCSRL